MTSLRMKNSQKYNDYARTILLKRIKHLELKLACKDPDANIGGYKNMMITLFKKRKNRYTEKEKSLASYLYIKGGRSMYETLYKSTGLPHLSTVFRHLSAKSSKKEGVLETSKMKEEIVKRKLNNRVIISEDATKIKEQRVYDEKSGKIVGVVRPFNNNGFPAQEPSNFCEDVNLKLSSYVITIMSRALDLKSPAFMLSHFSTDNRFNTDCVLKRWRHIKRNLKGEGIITAGELLRYFMIYLNLLMKFFIFIFPAFSSDGDIRYLSAMMFLMHFPSISNCDWKWWACSDMEQNCCQDYCHIGTKMRVRLLKPWLPLIIGKFNATLTHLKFLLDNINKSEHLLNHEDINLNDKMNYDAVRKIVAAKNSLQKYVAGSEGTQFYLELINLIIQAFENREIDPSQRIFNCWYVNFCMRIWRSWILESNFKLADNFVSSNVYISIEINAHFIIQLALDNQNTPENFLIELFNSQDCESFYRSARSISGSFETKVNFNSLEFSHRSDKIEFLEGVKFDLKGELTFPSRRKNIAGDIVIPEKLPNRLEIENLVREAYEKAVNDTRKLGMERSDENIIQCSLEPQFYITTIEEDEVDAEEDSTLDSHRDTDPELFAVSEDNNRIIQPSTFDVSSLIGKLLFC